MSDASCKDSKPIPITVFTGFLGVGKTSIILSLLRQLPDGYKAVLLKNEFGDIEVDSQLAKQSSLTAVSEILNGCMCCVLVGQMKTALLEIREKYRPDRIIVECSGSAFPATLAFQIRELERETDHDLKLDAIVTVIDAENFAGYEDTSPTAKMQASYTDIILINKWEHVSDRALDFVLDHLNTLNDLTPKIRCRGWDGVDPNLLFGVDTKLFTDADAAALPTDVSHNDEVETVTLHRGALRPHAHGHTHECSECDGITPSVHSGTEHGRNAKEGDARSHSEDTGIDEEVLTQALDALSKESVWRVKGFVRTPTRGTVIVNWAFGRFELTGFTGEAGLDSAVRLTAMGERGEVKRAIRAFANTLGADIT